MDEIEHKMVEGPRKAKKAEGAKAEPVPNGFGGTPIPADKPADEPAKEGE